MDLDAACEVMKESTKEKEVYLEGLRSRGVVSSRIPRVLERFLESSWAEVEDEVERLGKE